MQKIMAGLHVSDEKLVVSLRFGKAYDIDGSEHIFYNTIFRLYWLMPQVGTINRPFRRQPPSSVVSTAASQSLKKKGWV